MGWNEFFKNIGRGFKSAFKGQPGLKDLAKTKQAGGKKPGDPLNERKEDEEKELYDPWDEVRNMRMNFFLGSWATRKFRPIPGSDDKLRAELEALEKRREQQRLAKELKKIGLEPGQDPVMEDKLKAELEEIERKRREEKERRG